MMGNFAMFSMEGGEHLLRWIHFMAGITWIGILYFFNFIQGGWFKKIDAKTKNTALTGLTLECLWWFRWGAALTWISGILLIGMKLFHPGYGYTVNSPWGVSILPATLMGTFMAYNVWFIIWPAQRDFVIPSAQNQLDGKDALPEAAAAGARAGLASRTNTLFSIPLLFWMGASRHLGVDVPEGQTLAAFWSVVLGIIVLIEINGLKGKMGPMATPKGVIHCGLALSVVLYVLQEVLIRI
jgi:uncharacterized membrane protein